MPKFLAKSEKTGQVYTIPAHVTTIRDAVTWGQNYLDLSQELWTIEEIITK